MGDVVHRHHRQLADRHEVCGDAGPVELKVKEFFLSLVERIRHVCLE